MSKNDGPWFHVPAPDLRGKEKPYRSVQVTYPVSYTYNGGTIIDGEWYAGYEVEPPIVPEGYELVNIGVGLQLNAHPPYATMVLRKKQTAEVGTPKMAPCFP